MYPQPQLVMKVASIQSYDYTTSKKVTKAGSKIYRIVLSIHHKTSCRVVTNNFIMRKIQFSYECVSVNAKYFIEARQTLKKYNYLDTLPSAKSPAFPKYNDS